MADALAEETEHPDVQLVRDMSRDDRVATVALALDLGWSDPFALLRLNERDWLIACAIITEAQRIRTARYRGLIHAVAPMFGARA